MLSRREQDGQLTVYHRGDSDAATVELATLLITMKRYGQPFTGTLSLQRACPTCDGMGIEAGRRGNRTCKRCKGRRGTGPIEAPEHLLTILLGADWCAEQDARTGHMPEHLHPDIAAHIAAHPDAYQQQRSWYQLHHTPRG